jgi:hypothetical protein
MAVSRSETERNTPHSRRRFVSLAKKPSMALSHDAEVAHRATSLSFGGIQFDLGSIGGGPGKFTQASQVLIYITFDVWRDVIGYC